MQKTHYNTLGLPKEASEEKVKEAYRQLVKQYHPDVSGNPDDYQRFLQIKHAYESIMTPHSALETHLYTPPPPPSKHETIKSQARQHAFQQREKKRREQEALQEYLVETGYKDLLSAGIYIGKIVILVSLGLFPWLAYVLMNPFSLVLLFLCLTLLTTVIIKRRSFFKKESFPYLKKKLHLLRQPQEALTTPCAFTPGKPAEKNREQVLYFMFIQSVKMESKGLHDQHLSYKRVHERIILPRSKKSFYAHSAYALINLSAILGCLFFLDISSYLWRIIIGSIVGLIGSCSLLSMLHVKLSNAFLMTRLFALKWSVYLTIIAIFSIFQDGDIGTHPLLRSILIVLLFLDPLIENLLKNIAPTQLGKAIAQSPDKVADLRNRGFQYHLDIPIWNLLYPYIKIIMG